MKSAMARHILVKQKLEAEDLLKKLRAGADFAKFARKFSKCNSAKRGGDLGELKPGQLVPTINKIVFNSELNVIHGPVKTKFGYHLVEVYYRD
ncbi:peptidylprolyl isomerase [Lentisphaera profundi]|uniref:Peptidylprolyl isomerase n=1 Tax=Lentisphaera profundi TaxID=1658616 RepID=A0ABY7VQV7_9BACT|nr:peptidylprolyl isomerase [Lentisphaera profundi]WDE96094.1 peptidylprolyl isomerase [Lentisphaera profundi]